MKHALARDSRKGSRRIRVPQSGRLRCCLVPGELPGTTRVGALNGDAMREGRGHEPSAESWTSTTGTSSSGLSPWEVVPGEFGTGDGTQPVLRARPATDRPVPGRCWPSPRSGGPRQAPAPRSPAAGSWRCAAVRLAVEPLAGPPVGAEALADRGHAVGGVDEAPTVLARWLRCPRCGSWRFGRRVRGRRRGESGRARSGR